MDKNQLIIKAKESAQKLLESDTDYLDEVIELWQIGNSLYGQCWDTEFHVFGVIESDTDHLPLNKVRPLCSREFLLKSDQEIAEVIQFYKKDVFDACNKIIKL